MNRRSILLTMATLGVRSVLPSIARAGWNVERGLAQESQESWPLWHDGLGTEPDEATYAKMQDPAYMLDVVGAYYGRVYELARTDPMHLEGKTGYVRRYNVLRWPDNQPGDARYWAERWSKTMALIHMQNAGPVSVGGINLRYMDPKWFRTFVAQISPLYAPEWLGVHTYGGLGATRRFIESVQDIRAAQGWNPKVPVIITEASPEGNAMAWLDGLRWWLARYAQRLNIVAVCWKGPLDADLMRAYRGQGQRLHFPMIVGAQ